MKLNITFDEDASPYHCESVIGELNKLAESCSMAKVGECQKSSLYYIEKIIPTTFIDIVSRLYNNYAIYYEYSENASFKERGYYFDGVCFVDVNGEYVRC